MDDLIVNRRLTIPARDLRVEATTGSGPGGQRRNRVRTKVVLWLDLESCAALGPHRRATLRNRLGHRLTGGGKLSVACGRHREQYRNVIEARQRMAKLLAEALQQQRTRKATSPTRASKRVRREDKQRRSRRKQDRAWRYD
ncbi:MAG: aminoacyl-tRNA hydrolase [Phycisphaerales bacterium]|nr:aminoacyl-tRNA hydrolase [Phycisphaerales bacterium]